MQFECAAEHVALAELYDAHQSWLFGWLSKKLRCRFDAADLTQDTFVRVLHKQDLHTLVEPRAYLTTVAHGLMVNHIRRRDLEKAYLAELACLPESECPSPEAQVIVLELLIRIDEMLDGLQPKVRRAFLLQQLEGLTHAEIASRLEVSISSIRQYIAKALLHCMMAKEDNQ